MYTSSSFSVIFIKASRWIIIKLLKYALNNAYLIRTGLLKKTIAIVFFNSYWCCCVRIYTRLNYTSILLDYTFIQRVKKMAWSNGGLVFFFLRGITAFQKSKYAVIPLTALGESKNVAKFTIILILNWNNFFKIKYTLYV